MHGDAGNGGGVTAHDVDDLKGGDFVQDELAVSGADEDVFFCVEGG